MTQNTRNHELLSAMLDGECSGEEAGKALKWLSNDASARARLSRTCMAGDAMRGDLNVLPASDFADRVRLAVEREPTLLAPKLAPSAAPAPAAARSWVRPVAGFAIAASVAVVSFLALDQYQAEKPPAAVLAQGSVAGAGDAGAGGRELPSGLVQTSVEPRGGARLVTDPDHATRWNVEQREIQQRLNNYLLDHTEYARMGEMNGMLPYSRLVGYDRSR